MDNSGANPNLLEKIFNAQKTLMDMIAIQPDEYGKLPTQSKLIKDVLINAAGEVHEALAPLTVGTKPWKQGRDEQEITAEVDEEMVDVLFFLVEYFLLRGYTPEQLHDEYMEKFRFNTGRRVNKYLTINPEDEVVVYDYDGDSDDGTKQTFVTAIVKDSFGFGRFTANTKSADGKKEKFPINEVRKKAKLVLKGKRVLAYNRANNTFSVGLPVERVAKLTPTSVEEHDLWVVDFGINFVSDNADGYTGLTVREVVSQKNMLYAHDSVFNDFELLRSAIADANKGLAEENQPMYNVFTAKKQFIEAMSTPRTFGDMFMGFNHITDWVKGGGLNSTNNTKTSRSSGDFGFSYSDE